MSLHVSVGERSVVYRIVGDLSALPPSAFDSSVGLQGADLELEFFEAKGRARPAVVLAARLVAGGHREIELVAGSAEAVPVMRRIAGRLEERLPDWPSADEAFSGMALLERGLFYGRTGGRGYRTVCGLSFDRERHADRSLLLALQIATTHDPEKTVRFHRSSRRERDLVIGPETPYAEFLTGAEGAMRVHPDWTPGACQQVICLEAAGQTAHIRLPGPEVAFVARGPKPRALALAQEAIAFEDGTLPLAPRVVEVARLLGLG